MNKDRVRRIMRGILPDNQLMVLTTTATRTLQPNALRAIKWSDPRLAPQPSDNDIERMLAQLEKGELPPIIKVAVYKLYSQAYNVLTQPQDGAALFACTQYNVRPRVQLAGVRLCTPASFVIRPTTPAESGTAKWALQQKGLPPDTGKKLLFSDEMLHRALIDLGAQVVTQSSMTGVP